MHHPGLSMTITFYHLCMPVPLCHFCFLFQEHQGVQKNPYFFFQYEVEAMGFPGLMVMQLLDILIYLLLEFPHTCHQRTFLRRFYDYIRFVFGVLFFITMFPVCTQAVSVLSILMFLFTLFPYYYVGFLFLLKFLWCIITLFVKFVFFPLLPTINIF